MEKDPEKPGEYAAEVSASWNTLNRIPFHLCSSMGTILWTSLGISSFPQTSGTGLEIHIITKEANNWILCVSIPITSTRLVDTKSNDKYGRMTHWQE
jgi:hypothetical protein